MRLRGLGQRRRVPQRVVPAVEVEGFADGGVPQAGDHGQLLLQPADLRLREGDAVGGVLGLVPAGAEAQLDPAAGHLVDLGDLDGEHAGQPEGGGGHQRAQADPGGLPGQPGEGDPGVGGAGQAVRVAHAQVVVRAEEGAVVQVLGGPGHSQQRVVGGPLLGLGEDAQVHALILPPARPSADADGPGRQRRPGPLLPSGRQETFSAVSSSTKLVCSEEEFSVPVNFSVTVLPM